MSELPKIQGHRLVRLLGEGGMGRVYLAEDEALGRRTAIKIVSDRFVANPDARARFLREARSMATVEHPHVVRVYSFGETEGTTYLAMEYVEGEVLSDRVKRVGRLGVDEALAITRQVAEALEAAWEKRLVHRDIKPSNILLDTKGNVHVADFGLAKPIDVGSDDASLTGTGSILGTPHYISPEQARGKGLDFRSDVYSLGIVLFEMLTGRRPYEGTTPFDVVARHLHEPLPSLAERRPELSPAVVELVEWMTRKDPDERPASYAALRARLMSFAETGAATPEPTGTMQAARAAAPRRRWAAIGFAALTLAAGAYAWRASVPSRSPAATDHRLVVAVTPFYGPDEDSAKEGRMMAALVEKAIGERLHREDVKVLGVEETKQPVRDHDAARSLGERLGANAVVWGQAFALRGETEIQPYLTLVPRHASGADDEEVVRRRANSLEALKEQAGGSMVVGAQAANQIELRKTGAQGVGDMVLMLAGMHALYTEEKPEKALGLFNQAPKTTESLRQRAAALVALKKLDEARQALEEATRVDPKDAQAWGSLGDLLLTSDRFADAVAAYRRAGEGPVETHQGLLYEGRLYVRETYEADDGARDSGYLLALDPATARVVDRYRMPGPVRSFRVKDGQLEVSWVDGASDSPVDASATIKDGRLSRPLFYGVGLRVRRDGVMSGRALATNFVDPKNLVTEFKPQGNRPGLPKTFPELEAALRAARDRDPTQPWNVFYLGQAAWAQGRQEEGHRLWTEMFASAYPAIPYYEYATMAADFDLFSQPEWADRAYAEALARRRRLAQPIVGATLIDRLINARFVYVAIHTTADVRHDYDRAHVWLVRSRELTGPTECDAFAAAAWARYFRGRNDAPRAAAEEAYQALGEVGASNVARWPIWIDYATTPYVGATVAFWILAGIEWRAARRRGGFASVSPVARRWLLVAGALSLVTFLPVALLVRNMAGVAATPIGLGDALGSDSAIGQIEKRLREAPSDAMRWVAAGAHHLAGDSRRATELYQSLSGDARAEKNLEALARGDFVPPVAVTTDDVVNAYRVHTAYEWLSALWECVPLARSMWNARVAAPFALSAISLGLLLLLVGALRAWPPRPDTIASTTGRGYAILFCAATVVWAVGIAFVHGADDLLGPLPRFGLATADVLSPLRAFPRPPGSYYWTYFWAYPGARLYWSAIGTAIALAVALFVTGRRRSAPAQPPTAAAPDPDPETLLKE